jgi:putative pyruvate formate lyase activating enzyme
VDGDGVAVGGTICRLLILPGRAEEAVENLQWLAAAAGTEVALSVMTQYVPVYKAAGRRGWDRPVSVEEYHRVCEAVHGLGFRNGWIQNLDGETPPELLGFQMSAGDGSTTEREDA